MKMRLNISYKVKRGLKSDVSEYIHFIHIDSSILLKYVSYVIIDGVKYNRPKNDSHEIQMFYYFIVHNKMKITEIMGLGGKHYFLKNGEYHSYDSYCFYDPKIKIAYYAINGSILPPEEAKIFALKKKLNKLIKGLK